MFMINVVILIYFTLRTIDKLLKIHNLNIFDVSLSPISGGAWTVYFSKENKNKSSDLLKAQKSQNEMKLNLKKSWIQFSKIAEKHSIDLKNLVLNEVNSNGKIIAYGASARSSTILNYSGINSDHISMIIDKNPLKHGLLTAGSNIPIVSFEEGLEYIEGVDILLLLAWNFKDEIINELRMSGFKGKFIIPLPENPYML